MRPLRGRDSLWVTGALIVVSLSSKFRYHHFTTGVPASASLAGWIAPLGDGKTENRSDHHRKPPETA